MSELRTFSLASGSSGNCIFVEYKGTRLLVDAGITCKQIIDILADRDIDIKSIRALLITHEHSDHIKSLLPLVRKFNIPLYINEATFDSVLEKSRIKIDGKNEILHTLVNTGDRFFIDDLCIHSFPLSHDAVDPMGFRIESENASLSILTDCGYVKPEILSVVENSDLVYLEANYDPNMLINGPYPYPLKRRILSELGHLSNLDAALNLGKLVYSGTKTILLSHLSEKNNLPKLAFDTVECGAKAQGFMMGRDFEMDISLRHRPSKIRTVTH